MTGPPVKRERIRPKRLVETTVEVHTCPICEAPLPLSPSSHLRYLLSARKEAKARGDNDGADKENDDDDFDTGDVIAEQSICRRHRAETALGQAIRENKCPRSIAFDDLPFRLNAFLPHVLGFVRGDNRSPFMEAALDRQSRGLPLLHKSSGIASQMMTVGDTLTGYYGDRGQDIITRAVTEQIDATGLISHSMTAPFYSVPDFVRHVLVPEAAIFLIRQDHPWMGWREANDRRRDSTEWGLVLGAMDEEIQDGSPRKVLTKKTKYDCLYDSDEDGS